MSAFILSDLHISTIAIYIHHLNDNIDIQELANKLKSINIDSVDYRYGEKNRKSKCKIINNYDNVRYTKYDIIRLIQCWDYQSCEKPDNFEYQVIRAFLFNNFIESDITLSGSQSSLWSI
jgi:hypothetical protein